VGTKGSLLLTYTLSHISLIFLMNPLYNAVQSCTDNTESLTGYQENIETKDKRKAEKRW